MVRRVRHLLLPAGPDEGFREELLEDVRFGTLVIGGFQTLLAFLFPWPKLLWALSLGVATVGIAYIPSWFGRLRWVALCSTYGWLVLLQWFGPSTETSVGAAAVVICCAALIPLKPVEALAHGGITAALALRLWPVPLVAVAGAMLVPLQYRSRRARYESQLRLVRSTQELRLQQERVLSAEHVASLGRLAAAVSHELNTPVGAIRSSVQTLDSIFKKYSQGNSDRQDHLTKLHEEVCACLLLSTDRVKKIVDRLQRLTSLDRAALRSTDFNQILRDVAATAKAANPETVQIALKLNPVPSIVCETHAWTTILSRLVSNALVQPGQQRIELHSSLQDSHIVVELIQVGLQSNRRDLARSFDPGFSGDGARVGTTNWNLFQIRSWIQQLGGELRVSTQSSDARTELWIPVQRTTEAAAAG